MLLKFLYPPTLLIISTFSCLGTVKSVRLMMEVTTIKHTAFHKCSNKIEITYGTNDGASSGSVKLYARQPGKDEVGKFADLKLTDDFKKAFPEIKVKSNEVEDVLDYPNHENVVEIFIKAGYIVTSCRTKSESERFEDKDYYEYFFMKDII